MIRLSRQSAGVYYTRDGHFQVWENGKSWCAAAVDSDDVKIVDTLEAGREWIESQMSEAQLMLNTPPPIKTVPLFHYIDRGLTVADLYEYRGLMTACGEEVGAMGGPVVSTSTASITCPRCIELVRGAKHPRRQRRSYTLWVGVQQLETTTDAREALQWMLEINQDGDLDQSSLMINDEHGRPIVALVDVESKTAEEG